MNQLPKPLEANEYALKPFKQITETVNALIRYLEEREKKCTCSDEIGAHPLCSIHDVFPSQEPPKEKECGVVARGLMCVYPKTCPVHSKPELNVEELPIITIELQPGSQFTFGPGKEIEGLIQNRTNEHLKVVITRSNLR